MEDKNTIIAQFMGVDQVDIDYAINENGQLKYHLSWDWLIPVIEKIQEKYLENPELDESDLDEIRFAVPNIQEVHYLIVEFIKTYNDEKNTNKIIRE